MPNGNHDRNRNRSHHQRQRQRETRVRFEACFVGPATLNLVRFRKLVDSVVAMDAQRLDARCLRDEVLKRFRGASCLRMPTMQDSLRRLSQAVRRGQNSNSNLEHGGA
jgi:hypothetical protein